MGTYLAIDLGAESGRGVLGKLEAGQLEIEEIHRFPTGPTRVGQNMYWDVLRIYSEIEAAIGIAAEKTGGRLDGVGVDTWGVDFGLVDKNGELLGNPRHYRDRRTDGMIEKVTAKVPRERIFELTGIQFMQVNTIFQLAAMVEADSPALRVADAFLMMPDLFHFLLTGERRNEFTIATTSQLYNPREDAWALPLFEALNIPTSMLQPVVKPGTQIGEVLSAVCDRTGLQKATVYAVGSHDTASAVAAVPGQGDDWCYISSGTWSLMGVEVREPVIAEQTLRYNFTNEGGVADTIRLLKNIMGLWLVQECRRSWERQGKSYSYAELAEMAAKAKPFQAIIDPDHPSFLSPDDMPEAIRAFCAETGQDAPADIASMVRVCLEGLALKYRWVIEKLEEILGRKLKTIHIVGGGSQNKVLCQLAADATGRPVVTGPVEATAIGNLLVQALAQGEIESMAELRQIVRDSSSMAEYAPTDRGSWDEAYEKFLRVMAK